MLQTTRHRQILLWALAMLAGWFWFGVFGYLDWMLSIPVKGAFWPQLAGPSDWQETADSYLPVGMSAMNRQTMVKLALTGTLVLMFGKWIFWRVVDDGYRVAAAIVLALGVAGYFGLTIAQTQEAYYRSITQRQTRHARIAKVVVTDFPKRAKDACYRRLEIVLTEFEGLPNILRIQCELAFSPPFDALTQGMRVVMKTGVDRYGNTVLLSLALE
ncbi:MAG: hypothetical protein Kow0065_16290 [Methylomicrobium sp.]